MKYGFVINQKTCIGCHACTVACRSEHDTPLGVFRTWVKVVEKGPFPNTKKSFLVQRCNHCEDAPCVSICPTKALYKRADGIVDFNKDSCIGCKSCMQACPYEALYIDPATDTAAKCNFCAHRVDKGLQPACVIVCPTQSIISGDLSDPTSQISRLVGRENVQVRKPEKATKPQLYYVGADQTALNPEATPSSVGYMWSEPNLMLHGRHEAPAPVVPAYRPLDFKAMTDRMAEYERSAAATTNTVRLSTSPPPKGQIMIPLAQINRVAKLENNVHLPAPPKERERPQNPKNSVAAGLMAEGSDAQVDYNVSHERPWGFLVALYLWTKSIGSGAFMLMGLALGFGLAADGLLFNTLAPGVALVFIALTTLLLVLDLKHPERFLYILFRSNWTSWLVWGAYILIGFSGVAALWLGGRLIGSKVVEDVLLWPGVGLAFMTAGYSAFLFGQAKGRDLWVSPLLLPHLLVKAVLGGAAALLILGFLINTNPRAVNLLTVVLLVAVAVSSGIVLSEMFVPHVNSHVSRAIKAMRSGRLGLFFWFGFILLGTVVPLEMLTASLITGVTSWLGGLAGLLALAGMLVYDYCWVIAGQEVPLS